MLESESAPYETINHAGIIEDEGPLDPRAVLEPKKKIRINPVQYISPLAVKCSQLDEICLFVHSKQVYDE